jgi:hypothetical protein
MAQQYPAGWVSPNTSLTIGLPAAPAKQAVQANAHRGRARNRHLQCIAQSMLNF